MTFSRYDERPEDFAENLSPYGDGKVLNLVGGCCGTFPSHIAALKKAVVEKEPRPLPKMIKNPEMALSGLVPLHITPELGFVNIGERCNLMGSLKFKRLISNGELRCTLLANYCVICSNRATLERNSFRRFIGCIR